MTATPQLGSSQQDNDMHADAEETTPLVAPEAEPPTAVVRTPLEDYKERLQRVLRVPYAPFPWWRRLPFLGPDTNSIAPGQPLDSEQLEMLRRSTMPGHFECLAMCRRLATDCLDRYNAMHPDDEYEPAPGMLTKHSQFDKGICWTHGNFMARRKRSGCFSFLPAPRTLFFFEIAYSRGTRELLTCTALVDEPVTEAYSILGFPLWCSKRRNGRLDTICKTCSRRYCLPHPGIQKIPLCGHRNARAVCEMCCHVSSVIHPEVFKFGCPKQPHPN